MSKAKSKGCAAKPATKAAPVVDKAAAPPEAKRKAWATIGAVDKAARLEWQAKACPKRHGSAAGERAAGYWNAATVGAYLEKGGTRLDLSWDVGHGFVAVKT